MDKKFDFSGWATKANVLCSDGRTILKDAFKHQDGAKVPLVWNHQHNRPEEVLGHAILKNMEDGVYAYCSFNDTEAGQAAKLCVQHGDINALSIWANGLRHQGANVVHGMIREVSLVLAGANPSAYIDSVMSHSDGSEEECCVHYADTYLENVEPLFHSEPEMEDEEVEENPEVSEDTEAEVEEVSEEKTEDSENLSHSDTEKKGDSEMAEETKKTETAEEKKEEGQKTVKEVFETLNPEQEKAVYYVIARMKEDLAKGKQGDGEEKEDEVKHSEGGANEMKSNAFENKKTNNQEVMSDVLTHSEMQEIFADAQRCGSLKDAVLAHGITDIEVLFPDHKNLNNEPEFIKRDDDWVAKVLGGVHHTPFARIKSIFADITKDQARAKGYTKGNLKVEEVFKLLKRTTNPTTIYKKQKLDRDDMLDITDFNVIPWLKKEIRMMLNEEIARAIIIGDGRDPVEDANDKIDEECIRPIWKMEDLFTVKYPVTLAAEATAEDKANAFIEACIKSRKLYKGSGAPAMFMSEDMLTDCLLVKDANKRRIYETEEALRAALRVSEIIPVPVMEGDAIKRTDDDDTFELAGLYVNLKDYNVGTDKGGEIGFFEDFDLDYNQHKYLMETRCSGTLVKPHSAVAIEFKTTA